MEEMSDEKLIEIKRRSEAARPGPWKSYIEGRDHESGSNFVMVPNESSKTSVLEFSGQVSEADQDFIAHAREDIPALLAEIERLKSKINPG